MDVIRPNISGGVARSVGMEMGGSIPVVGASLGAIIIGSNSGECFIHCMRLRMVLPHWRAYAWSVREE